MIAMCSYHRRHATWGVCLALVMGASGAAQDSGVDSGADSGANAGVDADARAGAESDGLWPTPRQQELIIKRWARRLSHRHHLQTQQREVVEQKLVDRWTRFLQDQRPALRPLLNELIEMRIDVDPPSRERVREWATRAMPVFENIQTQFDAMSDDVRDVLTPKQRAAFELEMLAVAGGMELAGQLLSDWSRGRGDPSMLWQPIAGESGTAATDGSDKERDRSSSAQPGDAVAAGDEREAEETDQVERELTVWAKYVANRVEELSFDDAQRLAAQSCLHELSARARTHRDRYRDEIARLEVRIAAHDADASELASIKTELIRLYGPVDDMFAELKRRVDQLATGRQLATNRERAIAQQSIAPDPRAGQDQTAAPDQPATPVQTAAPAQRVIPDEATAPSQGTTPKKRPEAAPSDKPEKPKKEAPTGPR